MMKRTLNEVEEEIIKEFNQLDDWFATYDHLLTMGRGLEPLKPSDRNNETKIGGCQSQVWIAADKTRQIIHFTGDSDSLLVKGLIALVLRVVNDRSKEDVIDFDTEFIIKIGLGSHLSPSRAHGLKSIIKHIKTIARESAEA